MISNQYTFERERVVRAYERERELQKPEEVVLTMLRDRLKDMRMLDIGVGAGRTTISPASRWVCCAPKIEIRSGLLGHAR